MRIGDHSTYRPRLSFGVKKLLLELNVSLDSIKSDVSFNRDYGFYFDHSIYPSSKELTNLEVLVLYLEDRRFFVHRGFELRSLLRALRRFLRRGKIGGMSTIDQQVVRISSKRSERSIRRKLREITLAYLCNFHLSKKEIFDYYLHNSYLGYRIEGCEIAAQKIFGSSASDLTWEQAAFVASLYPLPFPKAAWETYSSDLGYPMSDPLDVLTLCSGPAERWSKRVAARMRHALKHQDFRPKSL
ncbi:MAG: transglycosylase domain-containing protein [Rhodobacterales bacterium]|nr:transglycosylase domain-containing protein [Rhodobacterales bacterium]